MAVENAINVEEILRLVLAITLLIVAARILGSIVGKFRFPEVLGEVTAGILFGPFLLGGYFNLISIEDFQSPVFLAFYWLGAIIILFAVGLETTFRELILTGKISFAVAVAGILAPFFLGYYVTILLGFSEIVALVTGAALTATSVAITVRVLEDLRKIYTEEAKIIINAAVIDDVLSIAVLSIISAIIFTGITLTFFSIFVILLQVIILWVIILILSVLIIPKIINIGVLRKSYGLIESISISIGVGLAFLTTLVGLSPILGAFVAGVALAETRVISQVKEFVLNLKLIFGPFFFATLGAFFNPLAILEGDPLFLFLILMVAIFSKFLGCGFPLFLYHKSFKKGLRVGSGMVSRGEVGLLVVAIALTQGIVTGDIYASLVIVMMVTTLISPILLSHYFKE